MICIGFIIARAGEEEEEEEKRRHAPTNGGMAALEGYSNGASTKNQRVGDGFLGRRHHIETEEEKAEGAERLVGGWVANWWIVRQVRGIQPQGA